MNARPVNLAASVRQRLFTLAKTHHDDFQRLGLNVSLSKRCARTVTRLAIPIIYRIRCLVKSEM